MNNFPHDNTSDTGLSSFSGTTDKMGHLCALDMASRCPSLDHSKGSSTRPSWGSEQGDKPPAPSSTTGEQMELSSSHEPSPTTSGPLSPWSAGRFPITISAACTDGDEGERGALPRTVSGPRRV